MQQKFAIYQNKKQKTIFQIKKYIYLLTKNLKTKKISKKLNYVKIDLFLIKKQKKSINYELNLFLNIKIYLIFHVSLLKSANQNTLIQNTFHFQYKKKRKRNWNYINAKRSTIFNQMKKLFYFEKHVKIHKTF